MILDDIISQKRREVAAHKRRGYSSLGPRSSVLGSLAPPSDFRSAILRRDRELPRIIAEVKRASPSKGIIREAFDPIAIARGYEAAGAAALSVLTDRKFFQGDISHLTDCRAATSLPTLRKDFIIDSCQIEQARAAGADAVLLIAALLDTDNLRSFRGKAESLGMAALVEAHDEPELESALESGARIVGINNRDLRTFEVDFGTTFRLAPRIPPGLTIVSESGIGSNDDLRRLADAGVDAALIGETLLAAPDPAQKLMELMGQ